MADLRAEKLKSLSIDRNETKSGPILGILAAGAVCLVAGFFGGQFAPSILGSQPEPTPPARASAQTAAPQPSSAGAPQAEPSVGSLIPQQRRGLIASGYVVARRRATVSPQVSGQLQELFVEEGDFVEAGEILARLDDELAVLDLELERARIGSVEANIGAIEADLMEARASLQRTENLVRNRNATPAAHDTARARVQSLTARLSGARADLNASRRSLTRQEEFVERFTVRAPFSGVIIDKNAQPGEFVSPASAGGEFTRSGVYTLVDMTSLELEVDVNESQIERVGEGQRAVAVLDAYDDWEIPTRVSAIIPTADRARATIQVRIAFELSDPRILPEMAAKVTFIEDSSDQS